MAAVKLVKLDEYNPELNKSITPPPAPFARKSDRACDFCRRRKTRCDGALTLGSKCTNCKRNQCPCTYQEASRPRGPPKAYVTALEDRIERFERLFKRLRPEADFSDILGAPIPRDSWKHEKNEQSSQFKGSGIAGFTIRGSQPSTFLPSAKPGSAPALFPTSCTNSPSSREQSHSSLSDDEDYSDEDWDFSLTEWPKRPRTLSSTKLGTTTEQPDGLTLTLEDREGVEGARFHGKSSFFPLVQVTRQYMHDVTYPTGEGSGEESEREGRAYTNRTDMNHPKRPGLYVCDVPRGRRAEYWMLAPWEEAWERKRMIFNTPESGQVNGHTQSHQHPIHVFPPLDLLLPLLSLYFHHTNSIFPLLHAPTFYSQLRSGLHERDAHFAGVVWAAIAVASRWSTDRRVLWDGWGSDSEYSGGDSLPEGEWHEQSAKGARDGQGLEWASAGWRFFMRSLDGPSFTVASLNPPSLYDLQFCSLAAMFLRGTSIGPAGWVVIGMGLRKALDVGAHRKKVYKFTNTNNSLNKSSLSNSNQNSPRSDGSSEKVPQSVENELWKRAFWMLVLFDRIGSASLGRPCCIREEDFDIDFPLEVDDEYWVPNDPSHRPFTQPPGKPSTVSGFVGMLKLTQIMAHALRTIYCIDKSKVLLGLVSDDWPQQIVSQLNTALDEWVESVPEHLRWSATHPDDLFSNQSATLYTTYYLTLILIYRPFSKTSAFIPDSSHEEPASAAPLKSFPFPADSICMSAAQSAVRIIDSQMRRGLSNIPNMISVAQMSAVTLLMGMYALPGGKTDPLARQGERDSYMADILKCIKCLELSEQRWIMARRFLSSFCASLPEEGAFKGTRRSAMMMARDDAMQGLEKPPMQIGSSIPTVPSQSARAWVPSNTPAAPQVLQPLNTPGNNGSVGIGGGGGTGAGVGANRYRPMDDPRDLFTKDTQDTEAALASRGSWSWFRGNGNQNFVHHHQQQHQQQQQQQRVGGGGGGSEASLRHHTIVPAVPISSSTSSSSSTAMTTTAPNTRSRLSSTERMSLDMRDVHSGTPGPSGPVPSSTPISSMSVTGHRQHSRIRSVHHHPHHHQHQHHHPYQHQSQIQIHQVNPSTNNNINSNGNNSNNTNTRRFSLNAIAPTPISTVNSTMTNGNGNGSLTVGLQEPYTIHRASTSSPLTPILREDNSPIGVGGGGVGVGVGVGIVNGLPISSTSRSVRASSTTSGQYLSVAAPQSAARDEYGGSDSIMSTSTGGAGGAGSGGVGGTGGNGAAGGGPEGWTVPTALGRSKSFTTMHHSHSHHHPTDSYNTGFDLGR